MGQLKRNQSKKILGKGRGVPMRLLRGIAKRYGLSHIIVWTADRQKRQRIGYWAMNDECAVACAALSIEIACSMAWENIYEFDCSSVLRLKLRIKSLETDMARIMEREGDPREIARVALKLPEDV